MSSHSLQTKADVRLSLGKVTWISEDVMDVVRREHANRINARDELVVQADQFRTQQQNLADALHRLNDIFVSAAESLVEKPPDPKKARRIKALGALGHPQSYLTSCVVLSLLSLLAMCLKSFACMQRMPRRRDEYRRRR